MNDRRTSAISGGTCKVYGGSAQDAYNHDMFDRPVNADPNLTAKNEVFIDSTFGLPVKDYVENLHSELLTAGAVDHKLYKSTVISEFVARANGVVLENGDAPPDFDLDGWAKATMEWADKTFNPPDHKIRFTNREGKEEVREVQAIFAAVLHRDERTPHIHFLVTPLTEDGRMSSEKTNSLEAFKNYQDSYNEAVKEFGLERGERNSPAKNIPIKHYYKNITRAMNAEAPQIIPGEKVEDYKKRCDDEIQVCHCHMADQDRDHEREMNHVKAEHNTYVKSDYKLHADVNSALGLGHSKDLDMERIREVGSKAKDKDLLDRALEHMPDQEEAGNLRNSIQFLIQQELERALEQDEVRR